MASSLALKKLTQQLLAVADKPAQLGELLTRLSSRIDTSVDRLKEVEQAIACVTEDSKRQRLALGLYRWLDVHRVWMADQQLPAGDVTVYTACVPFTVKNLALLRAPNDPLMLLTGSIDAKFALGPRDDVYPAHRRIVLALPLVTTSVTDRWAVNFMLANSHHDTPVDRVYGQAWAHFMQLPDEPDQVVFAFMFSLAVPRQSPRAPLSLEPSTLPVTPWTQYALDVLMAHAHALNTQHPQLGLQLHSLCCLSAAIESASDIRFQKLLPSKRAQVGSPLKELSLDGMRLSGLSSEQARQLNAERAEGAQAAEPRTMYGKAALGLVTCHSDEGGAAFGHMNLFSQSGPLALSMALQVPLHTQPSQLVQWWKQYLDPQEWAEVTVLPTVHQELEALSLGQTRDLQGRWVERELLHWGADAAQVFKTAKWIAAFGSEHPAGSADERQQRVPAPQTFEGLGLSKVMQAHYQPAFAQRLTKLLATPGMTHRQAFQVLSAEFPVLERVSWLDAYNAFVPTGLWAALHHELAKGVLFRVDPTVQEQLALTDVDKRFPLQMLHCPFPDIYIHLERQEDFLDESGKPVWLDGAFVSSRVLAEFEGTDKAGTRELCLTLVINDAQAVVAVSYPVLRLVIGPQDDTDLIEMLQQRLEHLASQAQQDVDSGRDAGAALELARRAVLQPVLSICKLLLYISLPEARMNRQMQRTELLARAAGAIGRDRQRLLDQASRAHDVITVGPLAPAQCTSDGDLVDGLGDKRVKPHLRRGFIRSQPYGEGMKLRRPKWIPPVFVNQSLIGSAAEQQPKEYRVK